MDNPTQMRLGKVRFSFPFIFKPDVNKVTGKEKYRVTVIIPKTDKKQLAAIKKCIDAAIEEGISGKGAKSKWGGKRPGKIDMPIHDGDKPSKSSGEPPRDETKGSYYMTISSDDQPEVMDKFKNFLTSDKEFYSGCYGYAQVSFSPYNKGSNGVGCYVDSLLKTEEGDRLAGGVKKSAEDAFNDLFEEGDAFDSNDNGTDDDPFGNSGSNDDDDLLF